MAMGVLIIIVFAVLYSIARDIRKSVEEEEL